MYYFLFFDFDLLIISFIINLTFKSKTKTNFGEVVYHISDDKKIRRIFMTNQIEQSVRLLEQTDDFCTNVVSAYDMYSRIRSMEGSFSSADGFIDGIFTELNIALKNMPSYYLMDACQLQSWCCLATDCYGFES